MKAGHILVVDDEAKLVNMMEFLLVKNGYKVSTALNGEDALIKVKRSLEKGETIDLLITDVFLPGITGAELIDEIEKMGMDVKILAISGKIKEWGHSDISHRKLNGYLSKPFGPIQLVEEIKEIMQGKKLSQLSSST